jgi:heat shock protein HslJ
MIFLSACATVGGAADPLDGSAWELFAYRKTKPIAGTTITAIFEDGRVSGSAGCNSYSGKYEIDGDQIRIHELAWTLMACMNPEGVMEQETTIMQFLSDAHDFHLSDTQLMIFRTDGEALTFVPQE